MHRSASRLTLPVSKLFRCMRSHSRSRFSSYSTLRAIVHISIMSLSVSRRGPGRFTRLFSCAYYLSCPVSASCSSSPTWLVSRSPSPESVWFTPPHWPWWDWGGWDDLIRVRLFHNRWKISDWDRKKSTQVWRPRVMSLWPWLLPI